MLGAITIAFTGFAVYLDGVEQTNRLDDIDAELIRAGRSGGEPPPGRPGPEPNNETVDEELDTNPPVRLVLAQDGSLIASSGAPHAFKSVALVELASIGGFTTTSDPRLRALIARSAGGRVFVTAFPLDDFDSAVRRFRVALAAGGGVILAIVALVLWVITGFLSRPVVRMADVANRIAAGDLDTPIGPPSGTRETADLAVDLEQMVARLRGALDDSNRSREATELLIADMAHEIRTPLTALKGYSDLYAQGMLEESSDVDRAMSRIGSESERLSVLANALLQLAQEGTSDQQAELFDAVELAGEVAADLRAAYPEQDIEFRAGELGPLMVNGSRDQLHQAILNLGSNACHHNPQSKPIIMSAIRDADAGTVRISVADQGPGVDPADSDRIFLPFFRSDAARSRDGQHGAGLGLSIARQIAEQHQGALTVVPTPGGGATFVLTVAGASG